MQEVFLYLEISSEEETEEKMVGWHKSPTTEVNKKKPCKTAFELISFPVKCVFFMQSSTVNWSVY